MRRIAHREISFVEIAVNGSLELVGVRVVDYVALIHFRHSYVYAAACDRLHLVCYMHRRLTCPYPAPEDPNQMQVLVVWSRQLVHRTAPERATVRSISHPQRMLQRKRVRPFGEARRMYRCTRPRDVDSEY